MSSYKNVLEELQRINDSAGSTVFVPSRQDFIPAKPLNIKKQKDIIKSAVDLSSTSIQFNISINKILGDLLPDTELLVTDKPSVLISLRSANIGNKLLIDSEETEEISIDLSTVVDTYKNIATTSKLEYKKRIQHENVTLSLRIPSLEVDTKFLMECKKKIRSGNTSDSVGENISEMFVFELAKFIDSVSYRTESPETSGQVVNSVRFSEASAADCVGIVEMLPMSINKMLVDYVSSARSYESRYVETSHDGKDVEIPVDASLFALE
jgi:hypothetical protein